ncbi:hypothetical protein OH492_14050 [Vibrio chagasii]|nr:hypothetical protein [Vibrio chagasii]
MAPSAQQALLKTYKTLLTHTIHSKLQFIPFILKSVFQNDPSITLRLASFLPFEGTSSWHTSCHCCTCTRYSQLLVRFLPVLIWALMWCLNLHGM